MARASHHVQARATIRPPDLEAEMKRLSSNIRRHSQALSRDLAQMRDLLSEYGIDIEFTHTPDEGVRSAKDQTP